MNYTHYYRKYKNDYKNEWTIIKRSQKGKSNKIAKDLSLLGEGTVRVFIEYIG